MNTPPRLEYYGDKEKAITLKGKALGLCEFYHSAMGDAKNIQRDHHIQDGVIIQVTITTGAYGDKEAVAKVYVSPDLSDKVVDFYIGTNIYSEDNARVYMSGYDAEIDGFTPKHPFGLIVGNGYFWFDDSKNVVNWYTDSLDNWAVIYKGKQVQNLSLTRATTNLSCCKVKGFKLITLENEAFNPHDALDRRRTMSINEYSLAWNADKTDLLATKKLRIPITTDGERSIGTAYFSKDGRAIIGMCFQPVSPFVRTIQLIEFGVDYSDCAFTTIFTDTTGTGGVIADDFRWYNNEIDWVKSDRTDTGSVKTSLYHYDKASKSMVKYETIDANTLTYILYAKKSLRLKVAQSYHENGMTVSTDGTLDGLGNPVPLYIYHRLFRVTVTRDGVDTIVFEYHYDVSSYLNPIHDFFANKNTYPVSASGSYDGKRIGIQFSNSLHYSVAYNDIFKHWLLIIDMSVTDHLAYKVELFYTSPRVETYQERMNLSITPPKKG